MAAAELGFSGSIFPLFFSCSFSIWGDDLETKPTSDHGMRYQIALSAPVRFLHAVRDLAAPPTNGIASCVAGWKFWDI